MTQLLILGLACFLVSAHYLTKVIEWYEKRKRFKDNKTEFTSDLYKLQRKWNDKGEFDYSKAINEVILFISIPEEPKAETHYGKQLQKKLQELNEEDEP